MTDYAYEGAVRVASAMAATPAMKLEVLFVGQVYRDARVGVPLRGVLSLVQDNMERGA